MQRFQLCDMFDSSPDRCGKKRTSSERVNQVRTAMLQALPIALLYTDTLVFP